MGLRSELGKRRSALKTLKTCSTLVAQAIKGFFSKTRSARFKQKLHNLVSFEANAHLDFIDLWGEM
jgi:hypothetical protein